jgi:hypothetical protein
MNTKTISTILGLDKTAAKKKNVLPLKPVQPNVGGGGAEGRIETIKGESKPLPLMPSVNNDCPPCSKSAMETALNWRMKKEAALSSITEDVGTLWNQLSEDQKMALIGGGVGAIGGGAYGALTGGEDRKDKIKKALLYGGLGAGVGAGAGYFGNQLVNHINPDTKTAPISDAEARQARWSNPKLADKDYKAYMEKWFPSLALTPPADKAVEELAPGASAGGDVDLSGVMQGTVGDQPLPSPDRFAPIPKVDLIKKLLGGGHFANAGAPQGSFGDFNVGNP